MMLMSSEIDKCNVGVFAEFSSAFLNLSKSEDRVGASSARAEAILVVWENLLSNVTQTVRQDPGEDLGWDILQGDWSVSGWESLSLCKVGIPAPLSSSVGRLLFPISVE